MEQRIAIPADQNELLAAMAEAGDSARFLASGTDLFTNPGRLREEGVRWIDLSQVEQLRRIEAEGESLVVGAMTTFREIASSPEVRCFGTALAEAARQVGSVQIRNRATIGGNVANASPAADSLPPLFAFGATVRTRTPGGGSRSLPIAECIAGPGSSAFAPGELIESFAIPRRGNRRSAFAKLGSRRTVSIARLSLVVVHDAEAGDAGPCRLFVGAVGSAPVEVRPVGGATAFDLGGDEEGLEEQIFHCCSQTICNAIPGRSSLPYKREAVRGLVWELVARMKGGDAR
ncbi:MAG: FAD binding domain-containing protein [Synergistales bacterium]|nr:FAD binding domain-containing protein [Synergistales bacterium]